MIDGFGHGSLAELCEETTDRVAQHQLVPSTCSGITPTVVAAPARLARASRAEERGSQGAAQGLEEPGGSGGHAHLVRRGGLLGGQGELAGELPEADTEQQRLAAYERRFGGRCARQRS